MVDVQPKSHDSGKTQVIMPITDRRHGGNAQKKFHHHTGVCLLQWPLRSVDGSEENMEPNVCRGGGRDWSEKQCCKTFVY